LSKKLSISNNNNKYNHEKYNMKDHVCWWWVMLTLKFLTYTN